MTANKRGAEFRTTEQHLQHEERCMTAALAVAAAPTLAVVANHVLNRPKDDPPPKIVLPTGTHKK